MEKMSCGEALTFIFFPLFSLVLSSEHRSPNLQKQLLYIAQVAITPILHQLRGTKQSEELRINCQKPQNHPNQHKSSKKFAFRLSSAVNKHQE
ncbi:hypothetical protein OSCI_1120010 [Kamptonema sp. PCC 6506]|nr:hypothetical protein OSCI_1120010 [Kamptonema sp. PCC 6506]